MQRSTGLIRALGHQSAAALVAHAFPRGAAPRFPFRQLLVTVQYNQRTDTGRIDRAASPADDVQRRYLSLPRPCTCHTVSILPPRTPTISSCR